MGGDGYTPAATDGGGRKRRRQQGVCRMADESMAFAGMEENAPKESAYQLSEAAVLMDNAREDQGLLAAALEKNMEVWIAIRLLAQRSDNGLSEETTGNLVRLSQFVAETIMKHGVDLPAESLDTLININLQISEGFLEGG